LPARLTIPKLKIDAAILNVGLTQTGDMDVPNDLAQAGWYKYGPLPGNQGSAVIAGHLDGLRGAPGIFLNLNKLTAGDSISVTDSQGRVTSFAVQTTRTYDQDGSIGEVFQSEQGAHLNLITCTGAWDKAQRHYLKRLVVFADKM
jgi:LPXTG-site transpeptidase (sortase) family protein